MDLRQLNALVAVAEYGSFSAAADALLTVQSNVSTHIKKLENELDMVLIDRSSGTLTEAGELVVARARRVMGEIDALSSDIAALSREVVGTVRLGAIGTAARWLVPQLVELAPRRHPLLRLVFVEATTLGLDLQLANGQVDLAVLGLPARGSEFRTIALYEEDLALVLPRSHRLAGQKFVRIEELSELPLILPLPGVSFRDELDLVSLARGIKLHPVAEMDSVRLIASITFEGAGFAILPSGAVPPRLVADWALVPVEGLAPRLVGVAQRRRSLPGPPVRAVLEILHEIVFDHDRTPPGVRPVSSDLTRPDWHAAGAFSEDPSLL